MYARDIHFGTNLLLIDRLWLALPYFFFFSGVHANDSQIMSKERKIAITLMSEARILNKTASLASKGSAGGILVDFK